MPPLYRRRPSHSTVSGTESEILSLTMGPGGTRSRSVSLPFHTTLNRMIPLGMNSNSAEMQPVKKNVLNQIDTLPKIMPPIVHIPESNAVIPTAPPEVLKSTTRRKRLTLPDIRVVQVETNEEKDRSLLEDDEVKQRNDFLLNLQGGLIAISQHQQQWNTLRIEEELSRDEIEIEEIGLRPQIKASTARSTKSKSQPTSLSKEPHIDVSSASPRNADIVTLVNEAAPTTRWNPTSCGRVISKLSSVGIYNANDVVEHHHSINNLLQQAGHKTMHPKSINLLYSLSMAGGPQSSDGTGCSSKLTIGGFTHLYSQNHSIGSF